jgi:MoaA/NifB/PqqE/SkfB family radical SAM enzyme
MQPLDRLHIEVTNVCNFSCEFCPDGMMQRRRGHMDPTLLEKILDQVANQKITRLITFHLMGEPLLYPHIFSAFQMAIERRIPVHLTTNGSTFALKPDHSQRLIESGIAKVTVSLQTPDPKTYHIRGAPPRLTPDLYFDGIRNYLQAHLCSDSPTRVHLKFLDTSPHPFLVPHKQLSILDEEGTFQQELQRWAESIFREIPGAPSSETIQRQIQAHRLGHWQVISLDPRFALETFPLDSWGNSTLDQGVKAHFGYCNGASKQAGILYDGTVVPCCKDYEGAIPLGNVNHTPLHQILAAEPACRLRRGFDRFQVENPVCQVCMGADTQQKATLRQIGSILYFKLYRPWMQTWVKGWGDV